MEIFLKAEDVGMFMLEEIHDGFSGFFVAAPIVQVKKSDIERHHCESVFGRRHIELGDCRAIEPDAFVVAYEDDGRTQEEKSMPAESPVEKKNHIQQEYGGVAVGHEFGRPVLLGADTAACLRNQQSQCGNQVQKENSFTPAFESGTGVFDGGVRHVPEIREGTNLR